MPELFGYISDASSNYSDDVYTESYLDDDYYIDDVITEYDLALMEFDQYVQEGVGVKILVGIGIVAVLGGLIALIIKCFSGKEGKSASNKTNAAKKALTVAKSNGATTISVRIPKDLNITQSQLDKTNQYIEMYDRFVDEYGKKVSEIIGKAKEINSNGDILSQIKSIGESILDENPKFQEMLDNIDKNSEAYKNIAKGYINAAVTKMPCDQVLGYLDNVSSTIKTIMAGGKDTNTKQKLISKLLDKVGIKRKATDAVFEKVTNKIAEMIKSCYDNIDATADKILEGAQEFIKMEANRSTKDTKPINDFDYDYPEIGDWETD